jgi:hypothetical protein
MKEEGESLVHRQKLVWTYDAAIKKALYEQRSLAQWCRLQKMERSLTTAQPVMQIAKLFDLQSSIRSFDVFVDYDPV